MALDTKAKQSETGRAMILRIILRLSMLVLLLAGESSGQQNDPDFVGPVVNTGLAKEAMVYHFRRTGDPGLLAEQLYAVEQYRKNVDPQQIVVDGLAKRREWRQLREAGIDGEWEANGYRTTALRLVGRAASQGLNAGSAGVEVANLAIRFYENSHRGDIVSRAAQRQAEEFRKWQEAAENPTSPEGQVFELTRRTCEESAVFCKEVWEPLFLQYYGFSPNSSDQAVLESYPEFANQENVLKVLELQGAQIGSNAYTQRLLNIVVDTQRENVDAIAETRENIAKTREGVADGQEYWAREEKLYNEQRARKIDDIEVAGQHAAVTMAATFIGFSNPSLGRQVRATSDAVFRARKAMDRFESAIELGASDTAAGLLLANDYLSVGLMLVGTFMDTGPTGDELILEQIGRLREEVQELRQEMHERFNQVYDALIEGFGAVLKNDEIMFDILESIASEMGNARSRLSDIGRVQLDTQRILVQQTDLILDVLIDGPLVACGLSSDGGWDRLRDGLTLERFEECRRHIEVLQVRGLFQQTEPGSSTTMAEWLRERPDRTISWSLQEFKRLLRKTGEDGARRGARLPASVVGPEAWFYIADLHDEFLEEYPEHAAVSSEGDENFVRSMRIWRLDLISYAATIRDELAAFQAGSRATVFSGLLAEAWDDSVRARVDEWSRRTLGDYNDEVIRTLEREMAIRNAYLRSWIALAFYDSIGRSDSVRALMEDVVRLPDRPGDWRPVEPPVTPTPPTHAAQEVGLVVQSGIRRMEEFLRSVAMQDVVEYGYGHSLLMETAFPALGDGS